ncbi:uncharacterized protein LOC123512780 isoform X1 [Portunus trituberculatus]|nr:uncharacterized protein LOC123512780 isoform X1 [Portunus trituberculatus]XP_045125293.1 uncharacterized protein LOC123512780 isoform X1 [Portunus trituberculatus]
MAALFDGDMAELFVKYLEGRMVGIVVPELPSGAEAIAEPEVGESSPPTHALLYQGGSVSLTTASASQLASRGLVPYPHVYLTTEHALTVTRALATLHAHTLIDRKAANVDTLQEKPALNAPSSETSEEESEDKPSNVDKWTAQITQLGLVDANLSVMVDALGNTQANERTVRRLEALRGDLPTLTQFLQFASVMQTTRVPSVGPVCIGDVWVPEVEPVEGEEVVAIRLRGGKDLQAPPLRDAAWSWLTLLSGETLRDRYMELCDDYCNAFNKALLRREAAGGSVEELSYFDVMRDLGENFLHAFLTVIHKFVVSGKWFFDRQLHTNEGLVALVDLVSFLVDNGIVGSIFVV